MAEPIFNPGMAAFLQDALSPQRQMQLTLEAAMRAGLLNPGSAGDGQSVMAEPGFGPMPPTLSGAENPPEITREPFRPRGRVLAQIGGGVAGGAGGGAVGGPVGAVAGGGLGSAGAGQLYDAAADWMLGTQERAPVLSGQTALDAAVGGIAGPVGPALRAIGNAGARNPTMAALLSTGAMGAAGTGQTSDSRPVSDRVSGARSAETDARSRLTKAEATLSELEKDETRYDARNFGWNDPNAVEEAQRNFQGMDIRVRDPRTGQMVPVPSDRRDGPLTRAGAAEYMRRAQEKTKAARADVAKLREALAKATTGIGQAEELDLRDISSRRQQELSEPTLTEQYGPMAGYLVGGVKGYAERAGLGKLMKAAQVARTDRANNLVGQMGSGSLNERAGRVNQFWTEGGSRNPPFPYTPGGQVAPFSAAPDATRRAGRFSPGDPNAATNAARLYQPGMLERYGPMAGMGGIGAAEWGAGSHLLGEAKQEYEAAQAAIAGKQAPTEAEISARRDSSPAHGAIRLPAAHGPR